MSFTFYSLTFDRFSFLYLSAMRYNSLVLKCIFFLKQQQQSFQYPLPWSECPKEYFENGSYITNMECKRSSPTQYFWYRETLDISPDINTPQSFNWKITLCLFIAWFLAYLCMAKGTFSKLRAIETSIRFNNTLRSSFVQESRLPERWST